MIDSRRRLEILPVEGMPLVSAGDDLAALVLERVRLLDGDVLALAQKIVSKAEGRLVDLRSVTPGRRALDLSRESGKDPRLTELILSEAQEVMRVRANLIIVRHRSGVVLANAGIDQSNIGDAESALLLPEDSDASCRALRETLLKRTGARVAVVIIDSLGRAWRNGVTGTAIGVAGMAALIDLRGRKDLFGREMQVSELAAADEVAAAASLMMGQCDEATPAVVVRGLGVGDNADGSAADLVRPREMDLFP